VLLTGGAGTIGQSLLPLLHQGDWRVRCLVHRRVVAGADELVTAALDDAPAIDQAVAGADAVLHLAGVTHARSARTYDAVNAEGTRALAEAAYRADVRRFVLVGSRAVSPHGGWYSRSKLAAESALRNAGVEYVIVRLPELWGAGAAEGVDGIRARAEAGRSIYVVGRGDQEIRPLRLNDVLRPLVRALDTDSAAGRTYTLAGERTTVRDFAERCAAAAKGRSRVIGIPVPFVAILSVAARVVPLPLYPDQLDRLRAEKPPPSPDAERELGFFPTPLDDALPRRRAVSEGVDVI